MAILDNRLQEVTVVAIADVVTGRHSRRQADPACRAARSLPAEGTYSAVFRRGDQAQRKISNIEQEMMNVEGGRPEKRWCVAHRSTIIVLSESFCPWQISFVEATLGWR